MEIIQSLKKHTNILKVDDKELILNQIYPYIYDYGKGKEVLRLEVLESHHSFEELLFLKNTQSKLQHIEKYDDGTEKEVVIYEGYYQDFVCNYKEGIYSIELTRISESDRRLLELEQKTKETIAKMDYVMMVNDMEEMA